MKLKKQNKIEFSELIETCLSDLNDKSLELVFQTMKHSIKKTFPIKLYS